MIDQKTTLAVPLSVVEPPPVPDHMVKEYLRVRAIKRSIGQFLLGVGAAMVQFGGIGLLYWQLNDNKFTFVGILGIALVASPPIAVLIASKAMGLPPVGIGYSSTWASVIIQWLSGVAFEAAGLSGTLCNLAAVSVALFTLTMMAIFRLRSFINASQQTGTVQPVKINLPKVKQTEPVGTLIARNLRVLVPGLVIVSRIGILKAWVTNHPNLSTLIVILLLITSISQAIDESKH